MKTYTITDYGYNGEGVCKDNGKVFFVPKTLKGEKVSFEIIKENSKFGFCKIKSIISPANNRISPPCPYYDKCGGCNFQHITYDNELDIKKEIYLRELSKATNIKNIDIIKSDKDYGYRNKVRFKVKNNTLGFYEEKTNNFIKIDNCIICDEKINHAISKIKKFLASTKENFSEIIIYSFQNNVFVDFLTQNKKTSKKQFENFDLPHMINHNGEIDTEFMGLKFKFKGDAFRQINDDIAEKLYIKVLSTLENKIVLNAYSGAGVLSGLIAKKAKHVYGIELNQNAHLSAESLKKINNIANLTNICGYAEKEIDKIYDVEFVVVDPPRAGCDKQFLQTILNKDIDNFIYISCNPATLVRDLKILQEKYEMFDLLLFDMFPQTANVETFVWLKANRLTKTN